MMFLVFILLYMGVLHKVHTLVEENVMKREAIETRYVGALEYFIKLGDSFISHSIFFRRIRILHRAAIVICGIIAMEASSIFYINSSSVIFHYVFASLSFALVSFFANTYVG